MCLGNRKGFTLIELTMVSILILVLINVSAPLFRNTYHRIRLESTCLDLSHLMRYLQTRSVVEGVRYRLVFEYRQGIYWGECEVRSGFGYGEFEALDERIGGRHRVGDGIAVEGDTPSIVFHPDGRADDAELTLKDTSGLTFTLTVHGSGIRFEEKGKEPS